MMTALIERAHQAVSVTKVTRAAKELLNDLASNKEDKYVLMRNNEPAAVMLSVPVYEKLCDEIDDLKMELEALKRLENFDKDKSISHEQLLSEYGIEG
ncbi:hypothetical protein [Zooshikella sp. RANM57]|uniref:hypothetical protein n=1 Tax=Zooshikella sp. RANM57 TaxID=3425863 RepID=UPI003D6FBC20